MLAIVLVSPRDIQYLFRANIALFAMSQPSSSSNDMFCWHLLASTSRALQFRTGPGLTTWFRVSSMIRLTSGLRNFGKITTQGSVELGFKYHWPDLMANIRAWSVQKSPKVRVWLRKLTNGDCDPQLLSTRRSVLTVCLVGAWVGFKGESGSQNYIVWWKQVRTETNSNIK